ncbi:phenazine biosynthesis-like [Moniliophthora roreri]|nr:phenazine biosynthesis-like [Moniliophthora roreri]
MSTYILEYDKLDVFTDEIFSGNPLAIVHLPSTINRISAAQKQRIAREFNLAETVFLHEPDAASSISLIRPRNYHSLAIQLSGQDGKESVPIQGSWFASPIGAQCSGSEDYRSGGDAPEPVASIVKGMTFILIELSSMEALARVVPLRQRPSVSVGDWHGFTAVYFYVILPDGKIRTRMFDGPVEDPATGSAASTLAVYLARKWGTHGTREFDIVQGVEIGRRSEIGVRVELGDDAVVKKVELAGKAVTVMNGRGLSGMYE